MAKTEEHLDFLGREFLTWLWFEGERNGGRIEAGDLGMVEFEFEKHMLLKSGGNIDESSLVSASDPRAVTESRSALQSGKKVQTAKLIFRLADKTFSTKLDTGLCISAASVPRAMQPSDPSYLQDRLKSTEELEGLIDTLFASFVRLRIDETKWGPVREAMRQWVSSGGEPSPSNPS